MHWNDLPGLIDQINQIKTTDILHSGKNNRQSDFVFNTNWSSQQGLKKTYFENLKWLYSILV